jgi:sulfite reductase (NADPH) flavoprotein alpha-component
MSPSPAALPLPLTGDKPALLARLVEGLDPPTLWWLSGYAAALALVIPPPASAPPRSTEAPAGPRLTVVYGSQSGNARRVAERLAQQTEAAGLPVRLLRADAYPLRELADERLLQVVISTQGDGDPPDDDRGFVEHLLGRRAPALPALRYAVLGLGDSSYPKFCEIGRRLDARLAELGATRALPRADADVDVDAAATPWLAQSLALAKEALKPAPALATVTPLRPHAVVAPALAGASREQPFAAEVLANQRLTGRGSDRDVRHLELAIAGAGLDYEPGDALGVWPVNAAPLVDAVLAATRLDGDAPVTHDGTAAPLRTWLAERRELTRLSRPVLAAIAGRTQAADLHALLGEGQQAALGARLRTQQPLDLLQAHPAAWDAEALVAALRPLAPRSYSIASSRAAVGDEVHLTVAHVAYAQDGEPRHGAASHFLRDAGEGARVRVVLERNERFRLPRDGDRDVIMIGPGTGVAPFRGFVQHRAALGARGRNWLFFGNPHLRHDFLYQLEWQQALRDGKLARLDVAWSRDQADKVYVQHRLREHGAQLHAWLEGGAHLYVCGDATRMARDVHAALRDVVATHGGRDAEAAEDYLQQLQQQGRYARDVY